MAVGKLPLPVRVHWIWCRGVFCFASWSHPTPRLICRHSHCAPSQWHLGSTLPDISKLEFFHNWRTGWTMKDRVNCDSSVKSTLDHCCPVDGRWHQAKARQTVWLACVRQGQTASPFNWRSASLSQLQIVWLLTLTMLAVHSCVLMELAVAVLSPSDVRMTKWSSCLVAVRGPWQVYSELEHFAHALHFLFIKLLSQPNPHTRLSIFRDVFSFVVQYSVLDVDRADYL